MRQHPVHREPNEELEDHDLGLSHDLPRLVERGLGRRGLLGLLGGAAVYLWHCNAVGEYSLYSEAVGDENYPRRRPGG